MERNKTRHYESTHTLKDEIDGRERLEAANFDLKLRVHHLEDALKRFTHTDSLGVEVEEITSENTNLKLQVHQQKLELQERNLVLGKAKSAIEALKKETERLRVIEQESSNANSDVARAVRDATASKDAVIRRLEGEKHDLAKDCRERLSAKDFELSELRHSLETKERQAAATEKLIEGMQKAVEETTGEITKSNRERDEAVRENRSLVGADDRARAAEEELTQLRAQVELYTLQVAEDKQLFDKIVGEKDGVIVELRATLAERTSAHQSTVEDVRRSYFSELEESSREGKKRLELLFKDDMDTLKKQVAERDDELRQMRKASESDRSRYEAMIRETEQLRSEAKESRNRLSEATEEQTRLAEEVRQLRDFKAEMQRTQLDLATAQAKLDTTLSDLEAMRLEKRDTDAELRTLQMEKQLMTVQQGDLKTKADFVESAARENERLKTDLAASESALKEAGVNARMLQQDLEGAKQKAAEQEALLEQTRSAMADQEKAVRMALREKDATQQVVNAERLRAEQAEAQLASAQTHAAAQLEDMRSERDRRSTSDTTVQQLEAFKRQLLAEATRTYGTVIRKLGVWSKDLDVVLDGTVSPSNSASPPSSSSKASLTLSSSPSSLQEAGEHMDALMADVLVGVERVGQKMSRVSRLRQILVDRVMSMADATQKKHTEANRACEMVELRIGKVTQKLDLTHGIVSRDHQIRMKELQDNRGFKESVLVEHTSRLQANSDRIVELSRALESETKAKEELSVALRELQSQLDETTDAYTALKEDAQDVEQSEAMMGELSERMEQLGEANNALQEQQQAMESEKVVLLQEKENLEAVANELENHVSELRIQLERRDTTLAQSQADMLRLEDKVSKLTETQMDPMLAQRIHDTQNLVEGTVGTTSRVPSQAAIGILVERLEGIRNDATSSTDVATAAVGELRELLKASQPTEDAKLGALETKVSDVLSSTTELHQRLGQVAAEWVDNLHQVKGGGGVPSSHSSRVQQSHSHYRSAAPAITHVDSSQGFTMSTPGSTSATHHHSSSSHASSMRSPVPSTGTRRHTQATPDSQINSIHMVPASPLTAPTFPASRSTLGSNVPSSVVKHRGLQQHQHRARQRAQAQSEQHQAALHAQQRSVHQTHTMQSAQQQAARAKAMTTAASSSTPGRATRTGAGTGGHGTAMPMSPPPVNHAVQTSARASTVATPLTAARASVTRLTKLSTDLHTLAAKLDKFESRSLTVQSALTRNES